MGSYITRKSHIGVPDRGSSAYPGPATDEEMEVAKRAAKLPKSRKATKKKIKTSQKKVSSQKSKFVESIENDKTKITFFKEPKIKMIETEKSDKKQIIIILVLSYLEKQKSLVLQSKNYKEE